MTDDDLMRFADGESDAATAAAVIAEIAADPAVAAKVRKYRVQRTAAATAFDDVLAEPVPDRLVALLRPAPMAVDLAVARAARARGVVLPHWAALAATLVVGFVVGHRLTPSMITPLAADAALISSLDGNQVAAVRIGFSYRDRANDFCRVFRDDRVGSTAGIACHENGGWRMRVAAAAAPPSSEDYRTAAADLPPAVLATVDATIAGAPLDARGEVAAAKRGWKR